MTLTGISSVYSGGSVVAGTAVNDLIGIVVTAYYSDGTSETVTGYTLTGEIAEGENIITVTYEGMTATFTVTGVNVPIDISDGYITDSLEFRLDGIRNSKDGHVDGGNFTDVSGNDHAFTTDTAVVTYNANHIDVENRNTIAVTDFATLLAKLSNYTFEVVWKAKSAVATTRTYPLVAVGNGVANYPLLQTGQMVAVGATTCYGSPVSGETQINHYTITYDGTTQKLYHEGVLDAEVEAAINITAGTKLQFFGNDGWSQHINGSQYAVRVYARALTADEVKANYNNDIARFGTGVA